MNNNNKNEIVKPELEPEILERILLQGDVADLTPEQRMAYYIYMCNKAEIDPAGRPFQFIKFYDKTEKREKMILYASKGCAEQLRARHKISVISTDVNFNKTTIIATCTVRTPDGRTETDVGAVSIGTQPDLALMKAVTKAKRRATLGICGLGDVEEAHPSEWVNNNEPEIEPRSNVLLQDQTGTMDLTKDASIAEPTTTPEPQTPVEPEDSAQESDLDPDEPNENKYKFVCERCKARYIVKPANGNCIGCHGKVREITDSQQ